MLRVGRLHFASALRKLSRARELSVENSRMSDVVLVLGMHRSGTSSVAGVLSKLGAASPKSLMVGDRSNPRGYFESNILTELNNQILASAGSQWDDWRAFNPGWAQSPAAAEFRQRAKEQFAAEFRGASLSVLKDPRICRFAPFWLDVFHDVGAKPHVVIPIRSPLDVARSLSVDRGYVRGLPITHGVLLWLRHVLDAERDTRSIPRSTFAWRDLRADWRSVSEKIARETDLPWPRLSDRAAAEVDRFLSRDLVHHETDEQELALHSEVNAWALRAYEALLELSRNPHSNSALATLDDVRQLLDQASGIFGRLLIDNEIDLEEARSSLKTIGDERNALQTRQFEILAEKEAAMAEFSARAEAVERQRQEIERAHGQAVQERNEISEALAAAQAAVAAWRQALEQEKQNHAIMLAELTQRFETAEHTLALSDTEKRDLAQALATAQGEQEALRAAHAATEADLQTHRQELQARAADLAEQAQSLDVAERAFAVLDTERRDLAQSLAATRAESDLRRAAAEDVAARLESAESELRRKQILLEDIGRRVDAIEHEKTGLAQQLETSFAEREALDAANAKLLEDIESERGRSSRSAAALDELAREHAQTRGALDAAQARAEQDRQSLARERQQFGHDLQQATAKGNEREAAQARALVETQTAHEARLKILRAEFVDAEAALSNLRRSAKEATVFERLRPAKARHRRLAQKILATGLFDTEFYRAQYLPAHPAAESGEAGDLAAAIHYVEEGFCHGCRPNPLFDSRWYLDRYDDVRRAGVNPLLHYNNDGWKDGRDPSPEFETAYYLEANPDVREAKINPLAHYLRHGRNEGRRAARPLR